MSKCNFSWCKQPRLEESDYCKKHTYYETVGGLPAAQPVEAPAAAKGEDAWLDEFEDTGGDRDKLRSVLRAFAATRANAR